MKVKSEYPIRHGDQHLRDGSDPIPVLASLMTLSGDQVLNAIIDGAGTAITTGVKGDIYLARAYTIVAWTVLADVSGSVVVDVWKDTYANFPPTVADTITASAKPTLSSAAKAQNTTLTGWTTAISAGDILRFNVDSATTVTRVDVALTLRPA